MLVISIAQQYYTYDQMTEFILSGDVTMNHTSLERQIGESGFWTNAIHNNKMFKNKNGLSNNYHIALIINYKREFLLYLLKKYILHSLWIMTVVIKKKKYVIRKYAF